MRPDTLLEALAIEGKTFQVKCDGLARLSQGIVDGLTLRCHARQCRYKNGIAAVHVIGDEQDRIAMHTPPPLEVLPQLVDTHPCLTENLVKRGRLENLPTVCADRHPPGSIGMSHLDMAPALSYYHPASAPQSASDVRTGDAWRSLGQSQSILWTRPRQRSPDLTPPRGAPLFRLTPPPDPAPRPAPAGYRRASQSVARGTRRTGAARSALATVQSYRMG